MRILSFFACGASTRLFVALKLRWQSVSLTFPRSNLLALGVTLETPRSKTDCAGHWLTRHPCKGDEFEILIFEAKKQNADIRRSRQSLQHGHSYFDWQACDSRVKICVSRLRNDSILLFKGQKRH